jgi:hypothetical protein
MEASKCPTEIKSCEPDADEFSPLFFSKSVRKQTHPFSEINLEK